jgi:hypothetical protein
MDQPDGCPSRLRFLKESCSFLFAWLFASEFASEFASVFESEFATVLHRYLRRYLHRSLLAIRRFPSDRVFRVDDKDTVRPPRDSNCAFASGSLGGRLQ